MAQITLRTSDALAVRLRLAAAAQQRSVNEYLTRLVEAATDPELAGEDAARTRERLARAGLLVTPGPPRRRPDSAVVAAARATAGRGRRLSDLITDQR